MKILNYRRTRNIKLEEMPDALKLAMSLNSLSFTISVQETLDSYKILRQRVAEVERGLYDNTSGLYCFEEIVDNEYDSYDDEDVYADTAEIKIRFETAEDMGRFEKFFMLMFKLKS